MRVLAVGIAAVIAPLVYFKYYGWFALEWTNAVEDLVFGFSPPLFEIVLPVGVSFYTFMAISYVVDVYRRDTEVAATGDVFLFLAFFPHLVAGPIVRADRADPAVPLPARRAARGGHRGPVADHGRPVQEGRDRELPRDGDRGPRVRRPGADQRARGDRRRWSRTPCRSTATSAGTPTSRSASRCCSGSGSRRTSTAPTPPTRSRCSGGRWHMTLSRWLRDYLYIPLGGNRKGTVRTYVNLMLTMLLGGLWHGAAWHFVDLGRPARGLPVGRPVEAGLAASAASSRRRRTAVGRVAAAARHVHAGLHRVGVLPGRLGGHGARPARTDSRAGASPPRWSRRRCSSRSRWG